ncbi:MULTISPECIES: hypothetical protein [unclassified Streptomyces]|uniref:hypothetical protein n=1 Tax=unclassified Streptomyces TaxID=2593676 RepID=UPI003804D02F
MSPRTVRPLAATATATVLAVGGLALTGAQTASAAPGDNGDVKIHAVGTPFGDSKDEPKVCRFYLAAFDFDTLQQVSWAITAQSSRVAVPQLSGLINLGIGTGHTAPLSLPDGQYKLVWTFLGETGAAKQKVFKVDCATSGSPTTGGNGPGKPPHGPVGAGGGGSAELAADGDSSLFGIGTAVAAALAGTTGLLLIRRSRRRDDGVA